MWNVSKPFLITATGVALLSLSLYFFLPNSTAAVEEEDEASTSEITLSQEQIDSEGIKVISPSEEQISISIPIWGRVGIYPEQHAFIIARAPSVALKAFKSVGDSVKEGELLALLESRELAEAKANYLTASRQLELSQTLLDKEQVLASRNFGAEQDLLQIEAAFQQAQIDKDLAEQKLYLFGLHSGDIHLLAEKKKPLSRLLEVKAPFDGIIIKRAIYQGQVLNEGEPIYEIANLDPVSLEFAVYSKEAKGLRLGQQLEIFNSLGEKTNAEVQLIYPVIDEENGKVKIIASLDNPSNEWVPGSHASGKLVIENVKKTTCVPDESIVEVDGNCCVFIAQDQGRFALREVNLGVRDDQHAEVLTGLLPGEQVVSTNAGLLKCELTKQEAD